MSMLFLKLLIVVSFALPAMSRTLGQESDSGTKGPPYAELVKYFASLPQKYPEFIQVSQFGTTPKGRPLVVLKVSYPTRFLSPRFVASRSQKAAILITGTTHGDEYLGIEDRLPEWFASEGVRDPIIAPYFQSGGVIYLVPIFNPDGYEARQRGNSRGVDLNRDFTVKQAQFEGFKEVETQAVRDMLMNQLKINQQRLLISMDYHCCIGAALYPWSFSKAPQLPADHLALYKNYGTIMTNIFGADFRVGTTPVVLGYSAIGTSKDYYYENYGSMSFTFEGEYRTEKNKFPQHVQMWRSLIQYGQLTRGILR
ncbi:MAG: succinylglutamate desuccinylase/aspartoacylase family protein [Bdellovibrionaceae bacterium]|nr:succinylglutamate desuccinylase/aspartoacylase family protein [Pseudobdellovibrionaceae bacterium]